MYPTGTRRMTSRPRAGSYSSRYAGSRRVRRSHRTGLGGVTWGYAGPRASFGVGVSTGHSHALGHRTRFGGRYDSPIYSYPSWGTYEGYIGSAPDYRVGYDLSVFDASGFRLSELHDVATANRMLEAARLERLALELLAEDRREARPAAQGERLQPSDRPAAEAAGDVAVATSVKTAIARGDAAFETGDYEAAREHYVRAIVEAGADPSVRIALGLADFALGRHADAARAVRWGAWHSPGLAGSAFDLRRAYGGPEDLQTHRSRLASFVDEHPKDADALFLLGFVRLFSGQRDEGIIDLQAYLKMPDHDVAVEPFVEQAGRLDVVAGD